MQIPYEQLHSYIREGAKTKFALLTKVCNDYAVIDTNTLEKDLGNFLKNFKKRYTDKDRHHGAVANLKWMQQGVFLVDEQPVNEQPVNEQPEKRKEFSECSEKQKKRRSDTLIKEHGEDLILHSAQHIDQKRNRGHSLEAALALYHDLNMTVDKWRILRKYSKEYGDYFPEYRQLMEEKERCYPEGTNVSERSATVKLQKLLDHTAKRIIATKSIEELQDHEGKDLVLVSKWGKAKELLIDS